MVPRSASGDISARRTGTVADVTPTASPETKRPVRRRGKEGNDVTMPPAMYRTLLARVVGRKPYRPTKLFETADPIHAPRIVIAVASWIWKSLRKMS